MPPRKSRRRSRKSSARGAKQSKKRRSSIRKTQLSKRRSRPRFRRRGGSDDEESELVNIFGDDPGYSTSREAPPIRFDGTKRKRTPTPIPITFPPDLTPKSRDAYRLTRFHLQFGEGFGLKDDFEEDPEKDSEETETEEVKKIKGQEITRMKKESTFEPLEETVVQIENHPVPAYVKTQLLVRVYSLLTLQLVATAGLCMLARRSIVFQDPQVMIVGLFCAWPSLLVLSCVRPVFPCNLVCLLLFTMGMGTVVAHSTLG